MVNSKDKSKCNKANFTFSPHLENAIKLQINKKSDNLPFLNQPPPPFQGYPPFLNLGTSYPPLIGGGAWAGGGGFQLCYLSFRCKNVKIFHELYLWTPIKALLWICCGAYSTLRPSPAFYNIQKLNLSLKNQH